MTPVEFWLPIGAIAFYLYDSAQLLWHNELVYLHGAGRWRAAGPTTISWGGRRLYLPNPLLPQRPGFKVHWSLNDPRPAAVPVPAQFLRALRPVGFICLLLCGLLLLLPLISWTLGAGLTMLLLFAGYYVLVLCALAWVLARRAALQLSGAACAALAFDALACAPFAINLVRRIALRRGLGEPVAFAATQFAPRERAALRALLARKLDEALAGSEPAPPERARIAVLLDKLGDSPP